MRTAPYHQLDHWWTSELSRAKWTRRKVELSLREANLFLEPLPQHLRMQTVRGMLTPSSNPEARESHSGKEGSLQRGRKGCGQVEDSRWLSDPQVRPSPETLMESCPGFWERPLLTSNLSPACTGAAQGLPSLHVPDAQGSLCPRQSYSGFPLQKKFILKINYTWT